MGNPVQDKGKFERCLVNQCCFFFTLRTGSLIIGVFQVVLGIAWFIGSGATGGGGLTGLLSGFLMLGSGLLVLFAIFKGILNFLWYAVYINIGIGIWLLIAAIILFITLFIGLAIGSLINMFAVFYFASVLRSYAFEFDQSPTETSPNPA